MPGTTNLELPSLQALQCDDQMKLLDAVDKLRDDGLGEITELPQLIVCGDQSCGKSSVLEAISGVPFPRKANLCTRFATEVILRRQPRESIKISIVPSEDTRPGEDMQRALDFGHELTSREDFATLFEKAKEIMGISEHKKSFSKDILRVEFCGPAQPQLTLVDLPGLIHAETDGQKTTDIELVETLVGSYLKNSRSIILAVVSAKNDINNQVILRKARQVDPQGRRTLGIITKPDAIDDPVDTAEFIRLARNQKVHFDLGWHVVKNLSSGQENAQQQTRDEQETEFFQRSHFSVLNSQNVGISTLRARLSKVLFNQIKTTLPKLLEEIESRLRTTEAAKEKLGPDRKKIEEQQSFLIRLSQSFYTICRDAIGGNYDHDFFRNDTDGAKRLCANLMNKHFEFANALRKNGAFWKIVEEDGEENDEVTDGSDAEVENRDDGSERTREWAIDEACKILKRSRGRELPGLPNPLLVGELFREYNRPWEGIARDHIADVWSTTKRFVESVLQYLTDEDVGNRILAFWLDEIMENMLKTANTKLDELLEVHKDHPMTTNPDFIENRRLLQQKRSEGESNDDMDLVAAEDAFDNMKAYYKVAMKLFMDNVPTLAIHAPIVRKIPEMLSPTAVSTQMKKETISRIAAESGGKVRHREETLSLLKKLENGARICKEYAPRPSSFSRPAITDSDQSSTRRIVENRNSSSTLGRGHSPSVSEDGRANARPKEQESKSKSSKKSDARLSVPGSAAVIPRPSSTGNLYSTSSPPSTTQAAVGKTSSSSSSFLSGLTPTPGQSSGKSTAQGTKSSDSSSTAEGFGGFGGFGSTPYNTSERSTPFGQSLFGSGPLNTTATTGTGGVFGSGTPNTAATTGTGGLFGSKPPNTTATTGTGGVFGSGTPNTAATTGTGGLFGSKPPNTTATTGTGGVFGSGTPNTAATTGTGGLFGSKPPNTTATTGTGGLFTSANTSTQPNTSAFGSPPSSNNKPSSTTGTGGLFTSANTSTQPNTSIFGSSSLSNKSSSTNTFGGPPGAQILTFANPTGFRPSSSAPAATEEKSRMRRDSELRRLKAVSTAPVTYNFARGGKFTLRQYMDINDGVERLHTCDAITFLEPFRNYSHEELRLADYASGVAI